MDTVLVVIRRRGESMNVEMAYLLGMICGNGEIQRTSENIS